MRKDQQPKMLSLCPCGGLPEATFGLYGGYRLDCTECKAWGPHREEIWEAIEAWNEAVKTSKLRTPLGSTGNPLTCSDCKSHRIVFTGLGLVNCSPVAMFLCWDCQYTWSTEKPT